MDRRALRELELLDVVELCGLRLSAQAERTTSLITEVVEVTEVTEDSKVGWLVLGTVEAGSDGAKLLESMMGAIGLKAGKDYRVAGTLGDGGMPGVKMILALDKESAGRARSLDGPAVVRTLHPDELLANPMDKAKAWEDLLLARRTLAGPA